MLNICKLVHPEWMSLSTLLFQPSGTSLDLVLAMCAHHLDTYTLCVINLLNTTSNEDNAFMWLPLAFQVQYRDFYFILSFICTTVWFAESFCNLCCITMLGTMFDRSNSHNLGFLTTGIACTANVQCISCNFYHFWLN